MLLSLVIWGCAATPSPAPSVVPEATVSATRLDPRTVAAGTPLPGDAATAAELAARFENAVAAQDWAAAWALLPPELKAAQGAFDDFAADRSAFWNATGGVYRASDPRHDPAEIRRWVVPDNYPAAGVFPATPNYDRAFLVRVDFPRLAGNNAGWEELLVAPLADGRWFIWVLR